MYQVELYAQVRRSVFVEGISEREASRRFGLARETVRKMLRYAVPPGYRRQQPVRRPKLDRFTGIIDQILEADQTQPKKQRHTAKRIFERLRDEHDFSGGYTIVKDYVREKKLGQQEMFVPLEHAPGDAQADFGEAWVEIAGVESKAHYLVIDLPQSDDAFVQAFPAETSEAFCEGHNEAFRYFGGVPRRIVYDNTKLAVARILGDGRRQRTKVFSELQSHYLFEDRFGRPGKGNDKGKVEGLVGYARRNFFVPIPRFSSWEALNHWLEKKCIERRERRLRGHSETIGERFERGPLSVVATASCPLRSLRQTHDAGHVSVSGALPLERLLGAGGLRSSRSAGQGLCRGSRDQLRQRGDCSSSPQLRAGRADLRSVALPGAAGKKDERTGSGSPHWPAGSCLRSSGDCGVCWRRVWASRANASTCRCCVCSRTSDSTTSQPPYGKPASWGRSASTQSSICCRAASNSGLHDWI